MKLLPKGAILLSDGTEIPFLKEAIRPTRGGEQQVFSQLRVRAQSGKASSLEPSPWLMPYPVKAREGLRQNLIYQTDGETGILRDKSNLRPTINDQGPGAQALEQQLQCIPVTLTGVNFNPTKAIKHIGPGAGFDAQGPFSIGDVIIFTPQGVNGTGAFTYDWLVPPATPSTSYAFSYTVDAVNLAGPFPPDGDMAGFVLLTVTNPCGSDDVGDNPLIAFYVP